MAMPTDGLRLLLAILRGMEIPCMAGGFIAAAFQGRLEAATAAEFGIELKPEQIDELVALLAPAFYVDASSIRNAIAGGRAFSVIHLESAYKIDVVPLRRGWSSEFELGSRRSAEYVELGDLLERLLSERLES
jgi:hypothetical protein